MITPREIFEEFYNDCREMSIEEVVKKHGGGYLYVPSYKSTYRDEAIWRRHQEGASAYQLQREFGLSASRVRRILQKMRQQNEAESE